MITKDSLKTAIEFAGKIRNLKGILSIVLFGSVAKGEDTADSDIDIAIIHDLKNDSKLVKSTNMYKPEKVQITYLNIKNLHKETELVGALSGDGLLLCGKPVIIRENDVELHPKVLVSYSLKGMLQKEKVKLNRALYGSISRSGKYVTETKGAIAESGVEKVGNGVLLIDRRKSTDIIKALKRFGAKVWQTNIWSY